MAGLTDGSAGDLALGDEGADVVFRAVGVERDLGTENAQEFMVAVMQPGKQPVEHDIAGSSFEQGLEVGAQGRRAARTRGALVALQVAIIPPDQLAHDVDGSGKKVGVRILAYPEPLSERYSVAAQLKMNVWVELVGADSVPQRREIASVIRDVDAARFEDFGLTLDESKGVQCRLQEELTQFQADQAGQLDRRCLECDRLRGIHDYRARTVHSLFGVCRVCVPRLNSCTCGGPASLAKEGSKRC